MPYKFLAFFGAYLQLQLCSCVHGTCSRNFIYECIRGKDFSYNENRKILIYIE